MNSPNLLEIFPWCFHKDDSFNGGADEAQKMESNAMAHCYIPQSIYCYPCIFSMLWIVISMPTPSYRPSPITPNLAPPATLAPVPALPILALSSLVSFSQTIFLPCTQAMVMTRCCMKSRYVINISAIEI